MSHLSCPQCQARLTAPSGKARKKVRCSACGHRVRPRLDDHGATEEASPTGDHAGSRRGSSDGVPVFVYPVVAVLCFAAGFALVWRDFGQHAEEAPAPQVALRTTPEGPPTTKAEMATGQGMAAGARGTTEEETQATEQKGGGAANPETEGARPTAESSPAKETSTETDGDRVLFKTVGSTPDADSSASGETAGEGDGSSSKEDGSASGEAPDAPSEEDQGEMPVEARPTFDELEPSILNLTATIDGRPRSMGTGFLVSKDGFAITSFHLVRDASAVVVDIEEGESTPATLWATAPDRDLALIKVERPGRLGPAVEPLEIAEEGPVAGLDVLSLGYPRGGRYTATKGSVNETVAQTDLVGGLARGLATGPGTRWIQTDCTIDRGVSGGPLINQQREVVGVCTFLWNLSDSGGMGNTFFAIAARHVRELLRNRPEDEPVGFDSVGSSDRTIATLPTRIDMEEAVPSRAILAEIRNLRRATTCPRCEGKGILRNRKRVVTEIGRPAELEISTRTCSDCDGTGLNESKATQNVLQRLIKKLARSEHPSATEFLTRTIRPIAERVNKHRASEIIRSQSDLSEAPNSIQQMTASMRFEVGSPFAEEGPSRKTPICAVGRLGKVEGVADTLHVIELLEAERFLLQRDPTIREAKRGSAVVVGGLYAGSIQTAAGGQAAVIDDGFIISLD